MKAVAAADIEDLVMAPPMVGHRQRLRSRFLSGEESALTEERLLDLLLTFAIPQKDVRPLASTLLERFGSLQAVLNADPDNLRQVIGIGDAALVLIKLVSSIAGKSRLPSKASKSLESDHLQQVLFPSGRVDSQIQKPPSVPLKPPCTKSNHRRFVHSLTHSGTLFPLVLSVAQRSRRASNQVLRMLRLRPPGYAQHERFW